MQIKGIIHEVGQAVQVSEKFKKRELVLEYAENPTYPEYIKFDAVNDKCDLLNNLRPRDYVTIHFNFKGKPFTDKVGKKTYFNSLQIWKIEA
jgi:hypothetical protein